MISTPGGTHAIGSGGGEVEVGSAVKTPWMPGSACAAEVSIEVIFACASGERTTAM